MARLKYMINNLESPILILHQESALFPMECLLFTIEGLQFRKTCVRKEKNAQETSEISLTFYEKSDPTEILLYVCVLREYKNIFFNVRYAYFCDMSNIVCWC